MIGKLVRKLGRLGVRLWGPFLLLALVSLVVGVAVLYVTYTDQRRYVTSLQQEITARASLRVSEYLQSVEDSLISGAQTLSFVNDDPTAQQRYLKSLLDANPAFFELALIDMDGWETVKVVRYRRVANQDLLDQSSSEKFLTASQGKDHFGPVYISEFAVPFYTLAVPVHNDAGLVIGVLAAEVNFDEMWNVVNHIPVGEAGYVYVVDGMGNLIVYHNLALVMQQPDVAQQVAGVQHFLAGDFQVAKYQNLDGQAVIGARQRIAGTNWGIITELPAREAYRTANLFAITSVLIFLMVLTMVLAMGWFIIQRVVRPLVALCQGASILGRGNLDYRIQVDATDEIEELAAEFNAMAASLQRSQAEIQARLREVSSLIEAGRAITSLDLQRVLDVLAKEAARAVEAGACVIYVLNEPSLTLEPKSAWKCAPRSQAVGEGVAGWVAKHKQTLRVENVDSDSRFASQEAAYAGQAGGQSLMGLPLMVTGRLMGVLLVSDKTDGAGGFTPSDERLLLAFADQAAVAVENAELYGEERRRSRELALVNRISRTITASLDLETTLDAILASVRDLLPYAAAEICLWDPQKKLLFTRGWGGDPAYRRMSASVYAPGEGYTGWIAQHHKPLLIPDTSAFDDVRPKSTLDQFPLAYVGVPLMVGDNFVGTLELMSHEVNAYRSQDLDTLQTVANQAAVAIENARLYHQEQRRLHEAEIMLRVTEVLSSGLSLERALTEAAQRVSTLFDAHRVAFVLFNSDETEIDSVIGLPLDQAEMVYHHYRYLSHVLSYGDALDRVAEPPPTPSGGTRASGRIGMPRRQVSYPAGRRQGRADLEDEAHHPSGTPPQDGAHPSDGTYPAHFGRGCSPSDRMGPNLRHPLAIEDFDAPDCTAALRSSHRVMRQVFAEERSLLLLPLATPERLSGAMALLWREPHHFAENEIGLATAIAQQTAVTVEKTRLLEEARRTAEVQAGLARIARIAVSTLDLDELIGRMMAETLALLAAEKGLLMLLDKERQELVAHPSGVIGAAPEELADFRVKVSDLSDLSVLDQGRPFLSDDAPRDWRILEPYRPLVQRFNVKTLLAVPLMLHEQSIGELYVVNKSLPFTQEDARFLTAIAAYMAAAVQNVRLFAATERNMREVSILYETTSALSSKLSVDELLNDLARRMSLALEADECTISEWDEASGILRAVTRKHPQDRRDGGGPVSTRGTSPIGDGQPSDGAHPLPTLPEARAHGAHRFVTDFPAMAAALRSQQPMTMLVSDPQASSPEAALLHRLGWQSMLMLPLVVHNTVMGLVEIYDANERHFTNEEIRLAQALTSQAAIALKNAQLFSLTDERLHKRIKELSGLQRVSQELNSTLDQDSILNLAMKEARRATGADFGNVSLYDRSTGQLLACASFGFSDEEMAYLQESKFYTWTGVMGRVLQTREPVLVLPAVSQDPDYAMISSESQSGVVVPIFYAGDVSGVVNLESRQLNAFSEEQLHYLEALANHAAVAIRNALAYEEQRQQRDLLRERAEQLARLAEISRAFRSDQPIESVLEDIAYATQETLDFNAALISVMRGDPPMLHRVAGAGIPLVEMERLRATPQSPEVVMDLMQDRFRLGAQSYHIPHTYKEIWEGRLDTHYAKPEYPPELIKGGWHTDDLCFSPLYNLEHQLIGTLSVDSPRDGQVPSQRVIETLEIFANQAAAVIENTQLFRSEQKRRRLADTLREVAEVVSSTLNVDQVIEAILDQLRHVVPYDSSTMQVLRGDELVITGGRGWDNMEDVLGLTFPVTGDNPNAVVLRTRAPYIVPDTHAVYAPFREPPHNHIRSWLGVPLLFGDNFLGMIALDSVDLDHYTQEHAQLALTFASQAAVALQNAQLFEQVRQYADRLRVINDVGVEITSILNLGELIARVSQAVEDNFGYQVRIGLIREDHLIWYSSHSSPENRSARPWEMTEKDITDTAHPSDGTPAGGTGWIATPDQPVVIPDITQEPYIPGTGWEESSQEERPSFTPIPRMAPIRPDEAPAGGTGGCRPEIAIPLKVHDRVIGMFDVRSNTPHGFSENDVLVLQSLASHTAVAIANAQLFERVSRMGQELEQRVQERTEALARTLEDLTLERDRVETLYRITRELSASLDLDRVLTEALSLINRAVGVSHGSIMLLDPGTGNLIYRAALGRSKGLPRGGKATRFYRGVGLAGWVVEAREPVIVPDVTEDPRWIPDEAHPADKAHPADEGGSGRAGEQGSGGAEVSTPERKSAMAVPLTAGEDVLGVLLLFHPEVGYFTPDHLKLVGTAATQVATAINNAELYQLITDQAERLGVMLRTQKAEAAKLQAIVEGIADGVLVLDANRHVMLMNPAAARILGLDAADFRSEIEEQHISKILERAESTVDQILVQQLYDRLISGMEHFTLHPSDTPRALRSSGESPGEGRQGSGEATLAPAPASGSGSRSGSRVPEGSGSLNFRLEAENKALVVNLSPVTLGSGELPSLVTVLRDISREAEVERLKNEFISTVSHELRTPMTSIKGYTDLLFNEKIGELSEQQRRFVQVIKTNADRLTALVNDILDISRIETGRIKLRVKPLDLVELINQVADNFRGQMVEKSLELVLDLPPSLPPVHSDEDRVAQILENLTSNAWKYTPEGGKVTVRASVVDGFAQVDVSDTGIGIAEKDLERIFDRFYRTEQTEVQAVDGTGLGLSIVKMFVETLGGEIWVESEVNHGSTFSFTLPLPAPARASGRGPI